MSEVEVRGALAAEQRLAEPALEKRCPGERIRPEEQQSGLKVRSAEPDPACSELAEAPESGLYLAGLRPVEQKCCLFPWVARCRGRRLLVS